MSLRSSILPRPDFLSTIITAGRCGEDRRLTHTVAARGPIGATATGRRQVTIAAGIIATIGGIAGERTALGFCQIGNCKAPPGRLAGYLFEFTTITGVNCKLATLELFSTSPV